MATILVPTIPALLAHQDVLNVQDLFHAPKQKTVTIFSLVLMEHTMVKQAPATLLVLPVPQLQIFASLV